MEKEPLLQSDFESKYEENCTTGLSNDEIDAVITETRGKSALTCNLSFAIAACILGSSFTMGYNTGVINAPSQVMQDFYNETYHKRYGNDIVNHSDTHQYNDSITSSGYMEASTMTIMWATTVSIFALGGMIGGLSAGYLSNVFGRRGTMLRNNLINVIGVGLMCFSKMVGSYEMVIAGRFVIGISCGISSGVAPLYLSEISPVNLRGFTGTFNQLAITLGVLVSETLGLDSILGTAELWPYLIVINLAAVAWQMLALTLCPETPRYLMINKDNEDEAEKALVWFRGMIDVSEEIEEMRSEKELQAGLPKFAVCDLFKEKYLLTPLIISLVLQMSQQFSGINAVIYYSTSIFEGAGLSSTAAQYATIATGATNVLMTFVSAVIIDKAGRRTLLLIGLGGLFIFSSLLCVSVVLHKKYEIQWLSYLSIIAVILYIVSFATGPGAIPWFIVAEFFSQGPRAAAVGLSVMTNWFSNFVVGLLFPVLNDELLHEYSFLPFIILLFGFWLFAFFKLPETKGRTIEEITAIFRQRAGETNSLVIQDTNKPRYTRLQESDSSDS